MRIALRRKTRHPFGNSGLRSAYGASGGEPDGLLNVRLLGRSAVTKDVVKKANQVRATALLQDALKAALLNDELKAEITSRLAEVKAAP